jgi:hypothetical protein
MSGSLLGFDGNQANCADLPHKHAQASANLSARFSSAESAVISKSPISHRQIMASAVTAVILLTGAMTLFE